jgi:hypothetical protein
VSKDKAGKKDKSKHRDLFEMMLNQSQVFRDMVEHFQSAWTPGTHSVLIETGVATPSLGKKQTKAAKAAPVTKPRKVRGAKKPTAAAQSTPAAVTQSPAKSLGRAKAVSTKPKRVTSRKTAGKVAAVGRVAKKK